MLSELEARVEGKKVLILGVGNRLRADDAIGSLLAERLSKKKLDIPIIDAGDVPENYLGPIEASGADLVLVVDAADMGASPGDMALIEFNELKQMGIFTHSVNLTLLFRVIPRSHRPEAILLAIQPETTEIGQMSKTVQIAMEGLERLLLQLFN